MYSNDAKKRLDRGRQKVLDAIKSHGGTTLLSTGITGDDARMAKAAVDAGAKLIEPNHPALALARGLHGVTNMHAAEMVRHEISLAQMLEVSKGVRNVVGPEIFITTGVPGGFTEINPVPLSDNDFLNIANAGIDGLHTHKSSIEDLKVWVDKAHHYGILVDAYIGHPDDLHTFGVPAETPEDVAKVAKQMEAIGVDFIGLMTGMSYEGVEAGKIHPVIEARVKALIGAVNVPTIAEGGINESNFKAFKELGVNILVVGTALDNIAAEAIKRQVKVFL